MDTIASAKFRKTYAKLTEITAVTVNGHAIGIWYPGERHAFGELLRQGMPVGTSIAVPAELDPTIQAVPSGVVNPFASRPFTPVPKPSKRK